jgi:hypothetical protein
MRLYKRDCSWDYIILRYYSRRIILLVEDIIKNKNEINTLV